MVDILLHLGLASRMITRIFVTLDVLLENRDSLVKQSSKLKHIFWLSFYKPLLHFTEALIRKAPSENKS